MFNAARLLKAPIVALALLAGAGMPCADAQADVILSPGESVVYNFDFSAVSPSPPYPTLLLTFSFFAPGGFTEFSIFGETNAGGDLLYFNPFNCCAGGDRWLTDFGVLDGEFSVAFRAIDASSTVATPYAAGVTSFHGEFLTPWVAGVAVPEPGTVALLAAIALGLAGRGFLRPLRRVRFALNGRRGSRHQGGSDAASGQMR